MRNIDIAGHEEFFREAGTSDMYSFWDEHLEDVMIETGTYCGSAVNAAIYKGVKEIHTIEIDPLLYNSNITIARANLHLNPGVCYAHMLDGSISRAQFVYDSLEAEVNYYLGDSCVQLRNILTPKFDKKVFFWLDGHVSGTPETGFAYHASSIGGAVPIYHELDIIKSHHIKNHTIIVDCDSPTVWNDPLRLESKIKEINKNYKFKILPRFIMDDEEKKEQAIVKLERFFGPVAIGGHAENIRDFITSRYPDKWDKNYVLIACVEDE